MDKVMMELCIKQNENFKNWCNDEITKASYEKINKKICKAVLAITDNNTLFIKTRSALNTQNKNIVALVVDNGEYCFSDKQEVIFCKKENYLYTPVIYGVFKEDILYKTNNKHLFYHGYTSFKAENEEEQKEFNLILAL